MTAGASSEAVADEGTAGRATVHAVAVALGDAGVLIRGASGSGKTSLALAAIARFAGSGVFAAMVADDQVVLTARNGRLIAACPAALLGLAEVRGAGVRALPRTLSAVRISLVVDLVAPPVPPELRWPQGAAACAEIAGVILPRLTIPTGTSAADGAATLWWVRTTSALTLAETASQRHGTRDETSAKKRHRGTL